MMRSKSGVKGPPSIGYRLGAGVAKVNPTDIKVRRSKLRVGARVGCVRSRPERKPTDWHITYVLSAIAPLLTVYLELNTADGPTVIEHRGPLRGPRIYRRVCNKPVV